MRPTPLTALALLAAVALVGCGQAPEVTDPEVPEADESVAALPAEPPEPAEPSEPETGVVLGDGVARHRAADFGIGPADCAKMRGNLLGAFLRFPTDERPGTGQAGPGPVLVEVTGCANLPGGNLSYELYHEHNPTPTLVGDTDGGSGTGWVTFRFEEVLWSQGSWTLRLLTEGEVLDEAVLVVG